MPMEELLQISQGYGKKHIFLKEQVIMEKTEITGDYSNIKFQWKKS